MVSTKVAESTEHTDMQKVQPAPYCLNCDEPLHGLYCHACGQKDIGERLNSRLMLHNLFESLTDLRSKPWRTLIDLVKSPGKVALAYIGGMRSSYINPVRFMVITFAVYIGFLAYNGWLEITAMETFEIGEMDTSDGDPETLDVLKQYVAEIKHIVTYQRNILTFIAVPIFSFFLRWFFFRSGRNFAETLTLTCYVLGQIQLYALLVALVPFFTGFEYTGMPDIIWFVVFWQGMAGFYQRKWIKTLFMTIVAYLLFSAVNGVVAISLATLSVQFN